MNLHLTTWAIIPITWVLGHPLRVGTHLLLIHVSYPSCLLVLTEERWTFACQNIIQRHAGSSIRYLSVHCCHTWWYRTLNYSPLWMGSSSVPLHLTFCRRRQSVVHSYIYEHVIVFVRSTPLLAYVVRQHGTECTPPFLHEVFKLTKAMTVSYWLCNKE